MSKVVIQNLRLHNTSIYFQSPQLAQYMHALFGYTLMENKDCQ